MRKIKYTLEIGFAGCQDGGEMEVNDDTSNHEIDDMVNEMALEYANSWEGDQRLFDDWDEEETEHFYGNVYGSWEFVE